MCSPDYTTVISYEDYCMMYKCGPHPLEELHACDSGYCTPELCQYQKCIDSQEGALPLVCLNTDEFVPLLEHCKYQSNKEIIKCPHFGDECLDDYQCCYQNCLARKDFLSCPQFGYSDIYQFCSLYCPARDTTNIDYHKCPECSDDACCTKHCLLAHDDFLPQCHVTDHKYFDLQVYCHHSEFENGQCHDMNPSSLKLCGDDSDEPCSPETCAYGACRDLLRNHQGPICQKFAEKFEIFEKLDDFCHDLTEKKRISSKFDDFTAEMSECEIYECVMNS